MKINKQKIFQHEHHRKPKSRRDFLAQGALGAVGSVMLPSILNFLFKDVYADPLTCALNSASSQLPFITLDLAGGYPMAQDFTPGGRGGQMDILPTYIRQGIPDELKYGAIRNGVAIQPDRTFGIPLHPDSSFLAGLKAFLPAQYRSNVDGFAICGTSNDDTNINSHNSSYLVAATGRSGQLVPTIGSERTSSGGNASPATGSETSNFRPVLVTNRQSAQNIVDRGSLAQILNDDAKLSKVRKAISSLSHSKIMDFHNAPLTKQLETLVDCGYLNMDSLLSQFQPTQIFPNDPIPVSDPLTVAFPNTNIANDATAAITRLVMQGYAGVGTISLGGYDSHSGNASDTRGKGFEAGRQVAKIIHYAALLNKPIMINIITDGGMGTGAPDTTVSDFTTNPQNPTIGGDGMLSRPGDAGSTSMSAVLFYVPGAAQGSLIRSNLRQVGAFTTDGVETNYLMMANNNPTNMAKVVTANYLAIHGREAEFKNLSINSGTDPFAGPDYEKYIILRRGI
jgi:hypothetical protein